MEAQVAAVPAEPHPPVRPGLLPGIGSELVSKLVQEWAWGEHSAPGAQRLCMRAHADQESLLRRLGMSLDNIEPSLTAIAKLGAWGKYPGNMAKELLRYLGEPNPPQPMKVTIPIKVAKPGRLPIAAEVQIGILLPHAEFANLWQRHRAVFDRYMLGMEEGVETPSNFWEGCLARDDPRLHGHPLKTRARWKELAVPLALHGDAAPCVAVGKPGTKSLDTISWASALSAGTTNAP